MIFKRKIINLEAKFYLPFSMRGFSYARLYNSILIYDPLSINDLSNINWTRIYPFSISLYFKYGFQNYLHLINLFPLEQ